MKPIKITSMRIDPDTHREMKILSAQIGIPLWRVIARAIVLLKADYESREKLAAPCEAPGFFEK
jgi:hypothetical protein